MEAVEANQTEVFEEWIERARAGDREARERVLAEADVRLMRLVPPLLAGYQGARRWDGPDEIRQLVLVRLNGALDAIAREKRIDFAGLLFRLARWVLINQDERHNGPHGLAAHYLTKGGDDSGQPGLPLPGLDPLAEMTGASTAFDRAERCKQVRAAIETLPPELRDVVDLLFFDGASQVEAALALGVTDKTIRNRYTRAVSRLARLLRE